MCTGPTTTQAWSDPDAFDPSRFVAVEPDRFAFMPHGGGDPAAGHRCAGERVTVELLKGASGCWPAFATTSPTKICAIR